MTDRELLQQALDALNALTKELLACRDELAERGARPETPHKQKLWDSAFNAYIGMAIPTYESIRARLAQPDSATHSAESAEFETAYQTGYSDAMGWKTQNHLEHLPPKKEWVGLTHNEINELFKNSLKSIPVGVIWHISRAIEIRLKDKNT